MISSVEYMQQAIRLAKKGLYTTDPNPSVGCVIVKDEEIVGEGWHQRAGEAGVVMVPTSTSTSSAFPFR